MKSKLKLIITAFALLVFPKINFGQAPNLGISAKWAIFSTAGAITNTGTGFLTKITGNVGTVAGGITGFGNVDGVMTFTGHADNAACAADILTAYNFLNVAPTTNSPGILLGNGQILTAGVHNVPAAATMNADLILDAQGNPNAVFIFQIQGPFATNTNSKVKLINGALACNVFWKVEGAVSMATGTTMRGTMIANNAAITMNVGDTLEGRAFAINGAVLVSEILAYTPIGCGSPNLTGPVAPTFGASACYAVFSSIGALQNTPVSNVTGDVGNASGALAGWGAGEVTGTLHPTGDPSTMAAATDLGNVNSYLLGLPFDIELLFPAQFGNNLVLTPHTYILNTATTLTDTVYLNGMGNPNAVFVIQIFGAFNASANSRVVLTNGTQAKNVYWKINGAVDIGVNSIFNGTMIVDGAFLLQPGVEINGRALTVNGAITTTAVTITVPSSISLNLQPFNDTTCVGGSASFSVQASGTGLLYQWRKGIVNLVDGGNILGAQTATLTINPVNLTDVGTDYNVSITGGGCGGNSISADAALILSTAPSITTEPMSQLTGCSGSLVSFSVSATGSNITYQWRKGNVDLINGGNISGATTATLTINPASISDTSSFYNVVIIDGSACAQNDTSLFVSLMLGNPIIVSEPLSQVACPGSSVTFSVSASGSGVLTYQWRKENSDVVDGGTISGAQTASLTINPISISDTSSNYYVVVTGGCSPTDTSLHVSLMLGNPIIITEPLSQNVCPGSLVSFSVSATGSGVLTYQWKKGTANVVNSATISGAQTATLTINPVSISDTSSFYNVVVTGTCAPKDTSINVSLMLGNPIIITEPVNQSVCAGNPASFSVSATGTGILTYQWRKGNSDVVNGGTISGAQTAMLTFSPVNIIDAASNYYVVVTGGCSPNDTSINVSLNIGGPVIITEPTNKVVCSGSSTSFSVSATGTGVLTYQWRKGNSDVVDGGTISGAQTATLTINPVSISDTASNYYVVVTGGCAPNDTSINVSLMLGNPIIITEPISQNVCPGSLVTFSVSATGSGVLTYQWKKGTVNVVNSATISGAQTATLTINPVSISDTSSFYNVVITGGCAPNDTSINVSLMLGNPIIITEPISQTVCSGSLASFSVSASGSGVLTYQWRKGTANVVDGGTISGAQSATLTFNPVNVSDTASNYYVVVTGGCAPNDTSINVSLMLGNPIIITEPINQSVCPGNSASFSVSATGSGILTYQWRRGSSDVVDGGTISGAQTATLTFNPVNVSDTASNYYVVVTGGCSPNDTSINVSLNIGGPVIITEPTNQSVCSGSSASFFVSATGSGILTYQWRKGSSNIANGGNISGAQSATLTINPASISDTSSNYYVVVTGGCAPNDTSINVLLRVDSIPVIVVNSNSIVCSGSSINLNTQSVSGGTYNWTGPNGYSSFAQNPIILIATVLDGGVYSLVVSVNTCNSLVSSVTVAVDVCAGADLSVIKTVDDTIPFIGKTVVFTITATNNGPTNATGVEVTDVLQSGYVYVSSTVTTGSYNSTTGVWTIGNFANGASATLTITATVIADGNYVNNALIQGIETDPNFSNNFSSIETFPIDFNIPEGFSPNGDLINDLFVIRGILRFPKNEFTIFNRWGNKVFEASPYKNEWDGKAEMGIRVGGDDLPVGTYFYLLDLKDGTPVYKGTIYLNK